MCAHRPCPIYNRCETTFTLEGEVKTNEGSNVVVQIVRFLSNIIKQLNDTWKTEVDFVPVDTKRITLIYRVNNGNPDVRGP